MFMTNFLLLCIRNLESAHHEVAVVHFFPKLPFLGCRAEVSAFGQSTKIFVGYLSILRRVLFFEVGFADVVNHCVFFAGFEHRLRGHHPPTTGQG